MTQWWPWNAIFQSKNSQGWDPISGWRRQYCHNCVPNSISVQECHEGYPERDVYPGRSCVSFCNISFISGHYFLLAAAMTIPLLHVKLIARQVLMTIQAAILRAPWCRTSDVKHVAIPRLFSTLKSWPHLSMLNDLKCCQVYDFTDTFGLSSVVQEF